MNDTNKQYLKDCIKENDLAVMGIYDKDQKYGIFHKWGKRKDIDTVLKSMKKQGLKDVFHVFQYPEFSLDQLENFIDRQSAWEEFLSEKGVI